MIKCNSGKVICTLKNSYPYDGDDKDDYLYMDDYDKSNSIFSEPIETCTINDKIKDNIILESDSNRHKLINRHKLNLLMILSKCYLVRNYLEVNS